jgi:putative acetyltransferase
VRIRPEKPSEFAAIYAFVKTAFATARRSDGDEQDFVDRLRARGGYIPELALVAEDEGRLIAHLMLTRLSVATTSGPRPALLLAPVSVAAERRNEGVGTRLVDEAVRRATKRGHAAVFVVGDPSYYGRFGFVPSVQFGIVNTSGIGEAYVMALPLAPGGLRDAAGVVSLPR